MVIHPRYDGPPILSIEPVADPLSAVVRQRQRLAGLLAGLDAEQWATPSRCEGWSVQDVIAHLTGVNAFWRASVKAGAAGAPTRMLVGFDPAATPPLLIEPMRGLSPAEALDQFASSNDKLLATLGGLDDSAWDAIGESPAGHLSIRLVGDHALWDSWVHERDVALPLGIEPAVESDEVAASLRYAAALSPAFAVDSGRSRDPRLYEVAATNPDVSFVMEVGDTVVVRSGTADGAAVLRGDAVELVEALSMRVPLPAGAPDEWQSMLGGGLATVFDAD